MEFYWYYELLFNWNNNIIKNLFINLLKTLLTYFYIQLKIV